PLRSDSHHCLDKRWFAIVPKPYPSHDPSLPGPTTQYVTHLLTREAAELWPEQHYISPCNAQTYIRLIGRQCKYGVLALRIFWSIGTAGPATGLLQPSPLPRKAFPLSLCSFRLGHPSPRQDLCHFDRGPSRHLRRGYNGQTL